MLDRQKEDMINSGFNQNLISKMSKIDSIEVDKIMKRFHQKEKELFWELEQEAVSPDEKEFFHNYLLNIEKREIF